MRELTSGTNSNPDPVCKRWGLAHGLAALRRVALPALMVLAVIYGSLIPFRFHPDRLDALVNASQFDLQVLPFRGATLEDAMVNLCVYAALAAALFCSLRRAGWFQAFGIIALCSTLSLVVELLQVMIPQRVSSATDVLLNSVGAIFGVSACALLVAWKQRPAFVLIREFPERPLSLGALALSPALLAYSLVPFDFVTDAQQLHDAFRRVHVLGLPSGLALSGELCGACWFALLGFLHAKEARARGESRLGSLGTGFLHGMILACLIECLQLLTKSHVAESFAVALGAGGALLGAWTAVFFQDPNSRKGHSVNRPGLAIWFLLLAAGVQFIFVGVSIVRESQAAFTAHSGWSLPFLGLWRQPAPMAAARALSAIVALALLAGTTAATLRRFGLPLFRAATVILVIGFCCGVQFLLAGYSGAPVDLTVVFLAVFACGCALRVEQWLHRPALAVAS